MRQSRDGWGTDEWSGKDAPEEAQSNACARNDTRSYGLPTLSNFIQRALLTQHHIDAELIERRRLGRTTLTVKPGLVGTHNSTKPENLGPFDYAHLRAPLPDKQKLKGSEIFSPHTNQPVPEVYFLMVREAAPLEPLCC